MAENSAFNSTGSAIGDAPAGGYTAAQFATFIRTMFTTNPATEGVLFGILNALAVTGAATPVAVASGAAVVYGQWYQNDASNNLAVPTPVSNPRKDYVVLRANLTSTAYTAANSTLFSISGQPGYSVRMDIIKGVENASPALPSLTQNANQWEVPIAALNTTTGGVITVTDARTYVRSPGMSAAFPYTTTGDIAYRASTGALARLGVASLGQVLKSNGTTPYWEGARSTHATLGTLQSIPNATWTAVNMGAVFHDTQAGWSAGSPSRLTAPRSSYYLVGASVGFDVNATGVRQLSILYNGADYSYGVSMGAVAGIQSRMSATTSMVMTAGDYVQASVWQNSGGALNVGVLYEHLWMIDIGP